jgi:Icc-related predicted phosphoesterase
LATELKKLEESSIPVCCVLGEHDINRDIPFPFFEDPNLARHLSRTQALCINDVSIFGFDKERKTNMASLLLGLETVQQEMKWQKEKEGNGKKNVLVLHQGIIIIVIKSCLEVRLSLWIISISRFARSSS